MVVPVLPAPRLARGIHADDGRVDASDDGGEVDGAWGKRRPADAGRACSRRAGPGSGRGSVGAAGEQGADEESNGRGETERDERRTPRHLQAHYKSPEGVLIQRFNT